MILRRLWIKFTGWLYLDDRREREFRSNAITTLLNVASRIEAAEMKKREWTRADRQSPIQNMACVVWAVEKETDDLAVEYASFVGYPAPVHYTLDVAQFRGDKWDALDGDREWARHEVKFWAYVENPPND